MYLYIYIYIYPCMYTYLYIHITTFISKYIQLLVYCVIINIKHLYDHTLLIYKSHCQGVNPIKSHKIHHNFLWFFLWCSYHINIQYLCLCYRSTLTLLRGHARPHGMHDQDLGASGDFGGLETEIQTDGDVKP